jgi:hypothetical protein
MGKRERRAPPRAGRRRTPTLRATAAAMSRLIPMVVEQTAQGERTFDIYSAS